jgi:hypothetical protein
VHIGMDYHIGADYLQADDHRSLVTSLPLLGWNMIQK